MKLFGEDPVLVDESMREDVEFWDIQCCLAYGVLERNEYWRVVHQMNAAYIERSTYRLLGV